MYGRDQFGGRSPDHGWCFLVILLSNFNDSLSSRGYPSLTVLEGIMRVLGFLREVVKDICGLQCPRKGLIGAT